MLSYQHIYHAGNFADVHKHAILTTLLILLISKDKPLTYIETHAGRGLYDLASPEAQKIKEYTQGIELILSNPIPKALKPFITHILSIKEAYGKHAYPGSPMLAQTILRPQDHLHLMELHPQEVQHLRKNLDFNNTHVHHRDGYEGTLAITPPDPRRGIILIDPSYEIKTEYQDIIKFIQKIHSRWPQATIALWYPILEKGFYKQMVNDLFDLNIEDTLIDELNFSKKGLLGSGMLILNAPYKAAENIKPISSALRQIALSLQN